MSSEEGPTTSGERRATAECPNPTKRVKSSSEFNLVFRGGITYPESLGIEESRPPGLELELTDSENVTVVGSGMVGNAPPNPRGGRDRNFRPEVHL